jgi:hypothetical protein
MSQLHRAIEKRTGWLFGTYRPRFDDINAPWFAVGPTTSGTGGEHYRCGVWVIAGKRGFYLGRADGYERGQAREFNRIEQYANEGEK